MERCAIAFADMFWGMLTLQVTAISVTMNTERTTVPANFKAQGTAVVGFT
jgi:hypothetical protein